MSKPPIIVDTNILFSSLLRTESYLFQSLFKNEHSFFVCELVFIELFKHKEKLMRGTQLPEQDVVESLYILMKRIQLFKEELIGDSSWKRAYSLCQDIDENDIPHVALTLEIQGLLWTGDKKLKKGLEQKGFDRFFHHELE
ncbi:MAG: PIN domain-containing protein [SAR324 cluster bacterium]|nr:PIN domain-containing protein [SAR324 cluster bacterium]